MIPARKEGRFSLPDQPWIVRNRIELHRKCGGDCNDTATIAGMVYHRLLDRLRQGTCKTCAGPGMACSGNGAQSRSVEGTCCRERKERARPETGCDKPGADCPGRKAGRRNVWAHRRSGE